MSISLTVSNFIKWVNPSKLKAYAKIIAIAYDIIAVFVSFFLTLLILNVLSLHFNLLNIAFIIGFQLALFKWVGLYRGFWRFASIQDLQKIVLVSIIGGIFVWLTFSLRHTNQLPIHSVALLYAIFLSELLSVGRLFVRFSKSFKQFYDEHKRVIIIGAGNAGEGLVRDLLRHKTYYKPVAFVDDDLRKLGREIHGIRVLGTLADLPTFIKNLNIDLALIAIPSASSTHMRSVVDICEKGKIPYVTLPSIKDITHGRVSINLLRNISLEDLLGRYPVSCNWESISNYLNKKTILVTGGGGSIGSELCRQIASLNTINGLIIVDSNEYNLYKIDFELRDRFPHLNFCTQLLNVTDRVGVQSLFEKYKPNVVLHAAAYKHVPLLENEKRTAIYNNVIGTFVLAEEAIKSYVESFILISSDKAVNPTNIMGATKRAGEYICHNIQAENSKTKFMTVRFGNVLDSAGSVIPLFRKQIELGGPITVTHPDITRFFMTIPEATQLILQAAPMGQGGEIYVLDMGDPIKISYLAEQMIKLAGKVVNQDIHIEYTGLRPGEKLYEECFYNDEVLQSTSHAKILSAKSKQRNFQDIKAICQQISKAFHNPDMTDEDWTSILKALVPEFKNVSLTNVCLV